MRSLHSHLSHPSPGHVVIVGVLFVAALALFLVGPVSPARGMGGGTQLWEARYAQAHEDVASALAVSPDGSRVYVTGYSFNRKTGRDLVTIAYDSVTGVPVWTARYAGPGDDEPSAMAVSPDGTIVYVSGVTSSIETNYDYLTIAYDITGVRLWTATYDGPASGLDWARSVAVSGDGSMVFVTGTSQGTNYDFTTVAYDATNGSQVWVSRFRGGWRSRGLAGGSAVVVSPDGHTVFAAGYRPRHATTDALTIAYDSSTGAIRWTRRYNGTANLSDYATDLAVSGDGSRVYVAGSATNVGTGRDLVLIAYDGSRGTRQWVKTYDGRAAGDDLAASVAVSPDSQRVYVTGQTTGPRNSDLRTLAYGADGKKLWGDTYTDTRNGGNAASGMVLSPDGSSLYVVGTSRGRGTWYDYTTIAYDTSTGVPGWASHYAGPVRNDDARAIGVSPDGSSVFVTGGSQGPGSDFDYETVAYSTS